MTLLSLTYGLFLLSVLGLYWSVERRSIKLVILLIASLVFYSSLQFQYIPLLLAMLFITFRIGIALSSPMDWRVDDKDWQFAQQDWSRRRLTVLVFGIVLNVLLLLGFKYLPFLIASFGSLFGLPNAQASADFIDESLIVPLGISYFCFECISYLIDVYRGAPATFDLLKFSSYKLFFPKLLSGPITRFHPFAAQIQTLQFPALNQIIEGLWLIASGAVKKLLLADHLAILVNLSFDNIERAGSGDLWLAIVAYGFQLYFDFSGYVDVALGSALLLGINLPPNFNFPYLCTNIADFWRRWHMSLGDWLRNYLYFPLGGSRKGLVRTCANLVIVMVIAGIWHNPGWGYVVWGFLHGLFLVAHRLTDSLTKKWQALSQFLISVPGVAISWVITQLAVFFAWIFFRLPDLDQSLLVVRRLWGQVADAQFAQKIYVESLNLERLQISLLLGAIAIGMFITYGIQRGLKLQLNWPLKAMLIPLGLFAAWLLAPSNSQPFVYFDF